MIYLLILIYLVIAYLAYKYVVSKWKNPVWENVMMSLGWILALPCYVVYLLNK